VGNVAARCTATAASASVRVAGAVAVPPTAFAEGCDRSIVSVTVTGRAAPVGFAASDGLNSGSGAGISAVG
jgi:hypothetical protein